MYIYTSYIPGLSTNIPEVALPWPLVDTKYLYVQHHTVGCLYVMFSTKVLIAAVECWEETWETDCVLYCVSKSQKCIVIFIKVRIFKFVLMTMCLNVFTIILFCMIQLKKFLKKMGKVIQTTSYWGTGIALLEMSHIGTLLDHMD